MDNAADPVTVRFSPDRRYTLVTGLAMLGAAAAAALSGDPAGRLLFTAAAVVLLGYVAADLIFSPRLIASVAGIVINAPLTRASLTWDEIVEIRAETRFRRGLRSVTLEIDAGPVLAVFSRRTLGVEPAEAATRIQAIRPR